jgi:hypothetical protein
MLLDLRSPGLPRSDRAWSRRAPVPSLDRPEGPTLVFVSDELPVHLMKSFAARGRFFPDYLPTGEDLFICGAIPDSSPENRYFVK